MRSPRRSILPIFLVVVAGFGCNEKPSPPMSSAAPPSTAAPQVTPSASAPMPAAGAALRYGSAEPSNDKWLVVSKGGVELAVLELRAKQPGVLHLQSEDAAAVADLKQRWEKLRGPAGIAVKMHLPPEDGAGRH